MSNIMSKEETQAAFASGRTPISVTKPFVRAIEATVRENYKGPQDGLSALLNAYVVLLSKFSKPGRFQSALESSAKVLLNVEGVGDGADLPDEAGVIALVKAGGDKDKAMAEIDEIVDKIHAQSLAVGDGEHTEQA